MPTPERSGASAVLRSRGTVDTDQRDPGWKEPTTTMTTDTTSSTGYLAPSAAVAAREAALPDTLEALAAVLRRMQATDEVLAPILSVATNGREVQIQPWIACAPVTAMRTYERHFSGAVDRRAVALLDSDGKHTGVTTLTSSGTIDGLRVTVSAATYREVHILDDQGRVSAETFAELAAEENPLASPDIADLLGIWDDPDRFSAVVGLADVADDPDDDPAADDGDDDEPAAAEVAG